MPLELTHDQRGLADALHAFLSTAASSQVVHQMALEGPSVDRSYWHQLAELGWTSLLVPEDLGGGSLTENSYADLAVIADLSGRHIAPGPLVAANVVASALATAIATTPGVGMASGGGAHLRRALEGVMSGEVIATWAVAEGRGTFRPADIHTTATKTGDGYRIEGRKEFVEGADDADLFMVVARTDAGLVQLLVEPDAAGLSVQSRIGLDPSRAFGSLVLDGVEVPREASVGSAERADTEVSKLLDVAIAIQTAETVGLMSIVFDMTIDWVQQRVAFGRTIGSYQALKHRLADHMAWLEASRGLVDGLADVLGSGSTDAARVASLAKAHIGDYAPVLISDAIQMHGGIGVTWEHDLHLYLRRATTNRALFGSPIEHRERLCALAGL